MSTRSMALNFLGINPVHALVFAGMVLEFSAPALMVLTNQRKIMGDRTNRATSSIFLAGVRPW